MTARRALASFLVPILGLTACGGGGSTPGTAAPLVQGKIVQQGIDGSGLAGIEATCVTTGEVTWTAEDGTFRFEVPSGESIQVRIGAGGASGPVTWDCDESDDGQDDGLDTDDAGVELEPLEEGEVVYIEIELRDGVVVECWVDGSGQGGEGECPMLPGPTLPEGARAELEVARDGECALLEIEVAGLEGPQTLTALLLAAGGATTLGQLEVDAEGAGRLEARVCPGDLELPEIPPLPEPFPLPGVAEIPGLPPLPEGLFPEGFAPEDLFPPGTEYPFPPTVPEFDPFFGASVVLVDADGTTIFVGFLPGPGLEPGEGWTEPGGVPPDLGDLEDLKDLLGLPGFPDDIDAIFGSVFGLLPPR